MELFFFVACVSSELAVRNLHLFLEFQMENKKQSKVTMLSHIKETAETQKPILLKYIQHISFPSVRAVLRDLQEQNEMQFSKILYATTGIGHYIVAIGESSEHLAFLNSRTAKIRKAITAAIETGQYVNGCLVCCDPMYDELKQITFMHQDKFVQTYFSGGITSGDDDSCSESGEEMDCEAVLGASTIADAACTELDEITNKENDERVPLQNESSPILLETSPAVSYPDADVTSGVPPVTSVSNPGGTQVISASNMPPIFPNSIKIGETKVVKFFEGYGIFEGVVVGRAGSGKRTLWTIAYGDGDKEELDALDIFNLVEAGLKLPAQDCTAVDTNPCITARVSSGNDEVKTPGNCFQTVTNADQQTFLSESPTASNAHGVAKLKCAQVPGQVETPVIQSDSVSEKSVSGKKKRRTSKGKSPTVDPNLVIQTSDISHLLQQHISMPAQNPDFCYFGTNCLEAQNDDNLLVEKGLGHGRALAKQPRTKYFCSTCVDSENKRLFMCKMCHVFFHARNGTWVLGDNTTCLARRINTTHGILDLTFGEVEADNSCA